MLVGEWVEGNATERSLGQSEERRRGILGGSPGKKPASCPVLSVLVLAGLSIINVQRRRRLVALHNTDDHEVPTSNLAYLDLARQWLPTYLQNSDPVPYATYHRRLVAA